MTCDLRSHQTHTWSLVTCDLGHIKTMHYVGQLLRLLAVIIYDIISYTADEIIMSVTSSNALEDWPFIVSKK